MTAFLNIALLIIGTAATLAAFGGKTWNEGSKPILTRITPRGWFSLICLVLALAIGTIKEVRTHKEDAKKDKEAHEAKDALADSRVQLTQANEKLKRLQEIEKNTQDRLGETKTTLEDVRGNLGRTHDELDRQGQVNLLMALANSDMRVKDVQVFVPFTGKGIKASTFHGALLPAFSSSFCRSETAVHVTLGMGKSVSELIRYAPDDDKDRHAYFADSPPKADILFHPTGTDSEDDMQEFLSVNATTGFIGQRSSNSQAIGIMIHVLGLNESAAHFLNPLQIATDYPLNIIAMTPYENSPVETDAATTNRRREDSVVCDKEVRQYFGAAFDKAYVGITFNQKTNLTIYFKLKALKPLNRLGVWTVPFVIESRPLVYVNDEFAGLFNVKWPDAKDASHDAKH